MIYSSFDPKFKYCDQQFKENFSGECIIQSKPIIQHSHPSYETIVQLFGFYTTAPGKWSKGVKFNSDEALVKYNLLNVSACRDAIRHYLSIEDDLYKDELQKILEKEDRIIQLFQTKLSSMPCLIESETRIKSVISQQAKSPHESSRS